MARLEVDHQVFRVGAGVNGLFPASRSQLSKPFALAEPWLNQAGIEIYVPGFSRVFSMPRRPNRAFRAIRQDRHIANALKSRNYRFFVAEPGVYFFRPALLREHLEIAAEAGVSVFFHWRNCRWILGDIRSRVGSESFAATLDLMLAPEVHHLAVSDVNGEQLRKGFGIQPIATLSNCVEISSDPPSAPIEAPALIVNAASVQLRKGPDLFLEIAAKVCAEHPNVEFVWLGGDAGQYQSLVNAYGLSSRVRFVSWTSNTRDWLQRSSGVLLTSRSEAFGLVAAEAMSIGRTVFTFADTGPAEVCGSTGVVVEKGGLVEMTEEVLAHLSRPRDLRVNEAASKRCFEKYSPAAFASRLRNILETYG